MKKLKAKLKKLDEKRAELVSEIEKSKGNLEFQCHCGELHKLKECAALQTHWYTQPSGCSDGDYWNTGGLEIICPDTGTRNRMVSCDYKITIRFRDAYYRSFKHVKDVYGTEDRNWKNNHFVDRDREYWGIEEAV